MGSGKGKARRAKVGLASPAEAGEFRRAGEILQGITGKLNGEPRFVTTNSKKEKVPFLKQAAQFYENVYVEVIPVRDKEQAKAAAEVFAIVDMGKRTHENRRSTVSMARSIFSNRGEYSPVIISFAGNGDLGPFWKKAKALEEEAERLRSLDEHTVKRSF